MNYTLDDYLLMSVLISFFGFCLENIWMCFRYGYIDNRNMGLPFLLGYSYAVLGIYFVLGTPDDPSAILSFLTPWNEYAGYYLIVFLMVSFGEIILGKTVERICGFYYWDYTNIPLHITRYTSVFTSMGFSLVITQFMKHLFLPVMEIISELPQYMDYIGRGVYAMMLIDFFRSFTVMYRKHSLNVRWKKQIFERQRRKQQA